MDDTCSRVVAKLRPLITHEESLKRLLRLRGQDAQELLDLFQWLLDQPGLDEEMRKHVIVSTQRISAKTGLYPVCHELTDGIEHATQAGAGGQADIYMGNCQGRCVCIKVMRVFETKDKELVIKHFWKEAILWRQLSHPNILPFYGLYRFQGLPCLVAPWMKNGTIRKYLEDNSEIVRLPLAVDVARGLNYLHDKEIIHGDLKGSNVLVDDSGTARVADFGISSISDPKIFTLTSHSGAASKGGTVRWQAPELFNSRDDIVVKNSKQSDAYAWACVCYEIFTGRIPLDHLQNDAAVMYHVAFKGARPSPPPSSSPPWKSWGLTEEIWSIMEECWKAEPSDRPTLNFVLNKLHSNVLSSEPDTRFSPRDRRLMTKSLSKSKIMSTMVLDELMLDHEPDAHEWATSIIESIFDGLACNEVYVPPRFYPKAYEVHNLAKRPTDYRPDFESRPCWWFSSIHRHKSEVEEFKDPTKRTVTNLLRYKRVDYSISYNLRYPPNPWNIHFPSLGRQPNDIDLAQLATLPPVDRMRLVHPLVPWYIDVQQSQDNGITVRDVIEQVFWELHVRIVQQHYWNEGLDSVARERIAKAFERRTEGGEDERAKGVRRVDYLGDQVVFVGLVRTRERLWEMKTVS